MNLTKRIERRSKGTEGNCRNPAWNLTKRIERCCWSLSAVRNPRNLTKRIERCCWSLSAVRNPRNLTKRIERGTCSVILFHPLFLGISQRELKDTRNIVIEMSTNQNLTKRIERSYSSISSSSRPLGISQRELKVECILGLFLTHHESHKENWKSLAR